MNYDNFTVDSKTAMIADVHGCHSLLLEILEKLKKAGIENYVFLGDLVDRGPNPYETVETVHKLVLEGKARVLVGNHDWKILRHLNGSDVNMGEDQINTLGEIGKHRLDMFKNLYTSIFKDMTIFLIDTENKVIASHAIALRPSKIHDIINDSNNTLKKSFWTGFLYGKSDSTNINSKGYPTRLPITYHEHDDLDGWKSIVGHYHTDNIYLERGNKNVLCVDFCAGEGGRLAAMTFNEDLSPNLVFSDSSL